MFNIRFSIRQRLTLLICTLLAAAIAVYGFVNYYSLKRTTLAFATERLQSLTSQVSATFGVSEQFIINTVKTAAASTVIKDYLQLRGKDTSTAVVPLLNKLHRDSTWVVAEVLDTSFKVLIHSTASDTALPVNNRLAVMQAGAGPDSALAGKMYSINNVVYFPLIAAVGGDSLRGFVVCWVRLKSNPQAVAQFSKLVGVSAQFYMGNMDGSLWTDLINPLPGAPFTVKQENALIKYTGDSGRAMVAVMQKVPHTNWYVGLGVAVQSMLQGVTTVLQWIIIAGVVLILLGIAAAWLMSRSITKPLGKLTRAAAALTVNNYASAVNVDITRNDELGSLAGAFNAMAMEVFRMHKDLEDAVKQRTRQLELANSDLKAFSYSVSHDLRAPLRAMQGFAAALKEDYGGKIDADADRMIEKIVANAEAMSHLIDDLLAFSHLGTAPVSRENVNMQQLATLVTGELLQDAPAGKYAMHIQQLPPVYADGAMLKQVLTNLIGNAVKYSAKKEHPVIEVGCEEEGEKTIYYVKDNGAGFNMTYVDKLFGVFQRLHSQQEFAGTGVGLALVRRIIDKHGGEIWAEAAEGQGAAFYFTLPYIN